MANVKQYAKKEIPESFNLTKGELDFSKILKHENVSLTSHEGKRNHNVLLLSTLQPTLQTNDSERKTAEVVHFYIATKYDMDVLDQMAKKYSTKSISRRWPSSSIFQHS